MQKVEGSSPFSRLLRKPAESEGFPLADRREHGVRESSDLTLSPARLACNEREDVSCEVRTIGTERPNSRAGDPRPTGPGEELIRPQLCTICA
jgi:hypothetical protein